jgi:hypothetical protein
LTTPTDKSSFLPSVRQKAYQMFFMKKANLRKLPIALFYFLCYTDSSQKQRAALPLRGNAVSDFFIA